MRPIIFLGVFVILIFLCPTLNAQSVEVEKLNELKKTAIGLYVTAQETYEMWKGNPEEIKILDVRTFEEYVFVGHAEMAQNIPLGSLTKEWDEEKKYFKLKPNTNFVTQVKEWANTNETILVMCRSGGRSAIAVNQLTESGFIKVYNIIDGMEGDTVKDEDSYYKGKRMKNGWKNSGNPWTYELDPEKIQKN